jgi:hypothetical protein
MGITALLSTKLPSRILEPKVDAANATTPPKDHKRSKSERIIGGLRKILQVHYRSDGIPEPDETPSTHGLDQSQLYRFQSPEIQQQAEVDVAPSTSPVSSPVTADSGSSPPVTADSGSSPPVTTDSSSSPLASSITPPTTPGSITPKTSTDPFNGSGKPTEHEAAVRALRDAEKILQRRHAAIKMPGQSTALKFADTFSKSTPDLTASNDIIALPQDHPTPSHRRHRRQQTANDACAALQRRQLVRNLAYRAMHGCKNATYAFDQLNDHFAMNVHNKDIPDLILNFEGVHIYASELRATDRNWILRFNAVRKLQLMSARKHLGVEDCAQIVDQLFPSAPKDLLKPEYFHIFITGLGIEGIITASEANSLSRLAVSPEELSDSARWNGQHRRNISSRHDVSVVAIFDVPNTPGTDMSFHLRVLIEAAAYDQTFWKGYFLPNARSKLHSFHEASIARTPVHARLASYVRPWTYRETRQLARGALAASLLTSFNKGEITDFGLIRTIRSSLIHIPGQPYWDPSDLSTYLYHRINDSGLPVSRVPEILALHPEHDAAFANPVRRALVTCKLEEEMREFVKEEDVRLREIKRSVSTFEEMKKRELGAWGRVRVGWRRLWVKGKGEVGKAFDPFDPFDPFEER